MAWPQPVERAGMAVESLIDVEGDLSGQVAVGTGIVQIHAAAGGYVVVDAPDVPRVERRPAPVRSLGRRPRIFVDRAPQRESARTAIRNHDALGFTGPPGMGKSTLLRQVAREAAEQDGAASVVLVDARDKPVDDVLYEIFCLLYDTDRPYLPVGGRLRAYLEDYDGVLLVDDADVTGPSMEHLLDALPGSAVVLTGPTRFPGALVRSQALGPLPVDSVAELVVPTGGVPDVELAATLTTAADASPGRIALAVSAIDAGADVAEALEVARAPVPADEDDRRVLAIVCAAGAAGLPADWLPSIGGPAARTRAEALVRRGLLDRRGPAPAERYVAPAVLLTAMTATALATDGVEQLVAELVSSGVLSTEGPVDPLMLDLAVPLVDAAARAGRWRAILALAPPLEQGLVRSGRWAQAATVLQHLLDAARAHGAGALQSRALHQLGTLALCRGELAAARDLLTEALERREAAGDAEGAQATRHNLARLPAAPRPAHQLKGRRRLLVAVGAGALLISVPFAAHGIVRSSTHKPPRTTFSPARLAFGSHLPGRTSRARTVVIDLPDFPATALGAPSIHGRDRRDFSVASSTCGQVQPAGRCAVSVLFVATGVGDRRATLELAVPHSGTLSVPLWGTGAPSSSPTPTPTLIPTPAPTPTPTPSATPSLSAGRGVAQLDATRLDFGVEPVGSVATRHLTVRNTGTGPLRVVQASVTGPGGASGSVAGCTGPLPPHGFCSLTVSLAPRAAGAQIGQLRVRTDASTQVLTATLLITGTGTGTASPDTAGPRISVTGLTVEAADANGAPVPYQALARDDVDGVVPVTCTPPSGQHFPLGDTAVTCVATDAAGNATTRRFDVVVTDTTGPVITAPKRVERTIDRFGTVDVLYRVAATDAVDGQVEVTCDHTSGSAFPGPGSGQEVNPRTTVVTCRAQDQRGNQSIRTFPVVVTYVGPSTSPTPAPVG